MKEFGFQWHITNFCNLRCTHCYQDDFSRNEDLDTETVQKILHTLSSTLKNSSISINLTGGEPFLRKDLFDILEIFERTKNIKEYNIITNAIPLNKNKIMALEKFKKLKQLKISLEDSVQERNDAIRGKGAFRKCMDNFQLLTSISSKEKILMFTLASYNYKHLVNWTEQEGEHEYEGMLNFAQNSGADAVILERFVPLGIGKALCADYLKCSEWLEVVENILQFTHLDVTPEDLLPYKAFHIEFKNVREVKGALCNVGDESMALMPNGDIYPCRRLPLKMGNILQDDFNGIVLKLGSLREDYEHHLKGICSACSVHDCIGCRALTYALTGDIHEGDPQCYHTNASSRVLYLSSSEN